MTVTIKSVQNMGYESYLTKDYLAGTDTTITVYDASKLPAAPNSIVIASLNNEDQIIVKYNAVSGNVLTVDTITHYNRPGANTTKYVRGCIAYKEFSDTVSGGGGGSGGTDNYNLLSNKPKINSIELIGNVSLGDIGAFKKDWGTTYNGKVIKIVDGIATPVDGTSSAVAFADITGQPGDNAALSTVLNDKLGKSGHTTSAGKIVKVGTTGELEFVENIADSVAYANITGNVTDNTALSNALNGKVPLSSTSSPIAGFGIDANGDVYVDIP